MMNEFARALLSGMVDESIRKRQHWVPLPCEQQKVLNEILEEVHDIATGMDKINANQRKVLPQYQAQVREAIVLKLATELGMMNGGKQL